MTNVWVHDPSIHRDVQAIFDPFGNAVHTALRFPVLGEDVLITGAGPIGVMAAAVVRHAGARYVVVTDVNPYRLELARRWARRWPSMCAPARSPTPSSELGMKEGFDVGLEMSGNPAGVSRHAGQHVPRRQDRHARHPRQRDWPSTGPP